MTDLRDVLEAAASEGKPRGPDEVLRRARAAARPPVVVATTHRRRNTWVAVAAVLVAVVTVVALVVRNDGAPTRNRVATPAPTTRVQPPSTTTGAPATTGPPASTSATLPPSAGPLASFRLGYEGMGPIKLGMTLQEASDASGVDIEPLGTSVCGDYFAQHVAQVVGHPEYDTVFGIEDGVIVAIDTTNPTISTISGIEVGDPYDDVLAVYANARPASGADAGVSGSPLIRITDAQGRQVTFFFRTQDGPVAQISVSKDRAHERYISHMC